MCKHVALDVLSGLCGRAVTLSCGAGRCTCTCWLPFSRLARTNFAFGRPPLWPHRLVVKRGPVMRVQDRVWFFLALRNCGGLDGARPVRCMRTCTAVLYPLSSSAPPGPRCVVPMTILNLYFMQGSIKECLVASEQNRDLLCTLQPSRIVTMLLSMLTSAALFRYTLRVDCSLCALPVCCKTATRSAMSRTSSTSGTRRRSSISSASESVKTGNSSWPRS